MSFVRNTRSLPSCKLITPFNCLYVFVEWNLELIHHVIVARIIQSIQSILDFTDIVIDQGAKQAIPDRENVAVVGVGPWTFKVVMKFVHIGGDEDPTDRPVDPLGKLDIRMRED